MWPFPLSQNVTLESKQKELYLDTKTDFISSSIQDYKLLSMTISFYGLGGTPLEQNKLILLLYLYKLFLDFTGP